MLRLIAGTNKKDWRRETPVVSNLKLTNKCHPSKAL
jgi:hypothetical protein